jgi:serine/threonine protein phosphatase 1
MRVLAIGDVHGCSLMLDDLLAWVAPAADDTLVTLGDYVNRGPDSRGVLDRLVAMKRDGKRLVCLRGNHELMMLAARTGDRGASADWLGVGGLQTLGSYGRAPGRSGALADVPQEHWDFLEYNLLDYFETPTHVFVHAGLSPEEPLDEQDDMWLYWEFLRDDMRHVSGKTIVCGHTSQKGGVPKVVPGAVCIDTYAHGGGWLTCLDAASGRYWQVNLMGKRREGRVDYEE